MKIFFFFLLCILLLTGISGLFYLNQAGKVYKVDAPVEFQISPGESTADIVQRLEDRGIIDNYYITLLYVRSHNSLFIPGTFTIPQEYSLSDLTVLFKKEQTTEKKLTIPEGYSREQIAEEISNYGLSSEKFMELARQTEGMLFPDTYNVDVKTSEEELYNRMVSNYQKQIADLAVAASDLILASIVEREAKTDTERTIIAGIYHNRLKINMPLEADPTVQYAKYTNLGQAPLKDGKKNFWASITKSDYTNVKSPYNTYLNRGLPPGPICNPGLKSIQAAVSPAKTDALFFFHTSDGKIITSRTLDEHNANKAKYLH